VPKITLKELAEKTGFSISAISLALNDRPGISPENRERILQAAQEMGYQQRKGKAQVRKSKQIIILYFSKDVVNTSDAVFPQLMNYIQEAAENMGWTVKLHFHPVGHTLDWDTLRTGAGIIMMGHGELALQEIREVLEMGMPALLLDMELPAANCDSVSIDNYQAIWQGYTWLWEHGYKRIAYVCFRPEFPPVSRYNESDRLAAYRTVAAEAGCEAIVCALDDFDYRQEFYNWYQQLDEKPDAYLFSMDYLARDLQPMMDMMKLGVGRDCAVIGLDNLHFCENSTPTMSSVDPNTAERARVAVQRLLARIRDPEAIPQHIRISTQLVLRESSPDKTNEHP